MPLGNGGIFPNGSNVISELTKCNEDSEQLNIEMHAKECSVHCWDFECENDNPYQDQIGDVVLTNFQPCKVKVESNGSDHLRFDTFSNDQTTITKGCDLVCSKSLIQCDKTVAETVSLNECGWTVKFDFRLNGDNGFRYYLEENAGLDGPKVILLDISNEDVYLRVYLRSVSNDDYELVVETPNGTANLNIAATDPFNNFVQVGIAVGPCNISLFLKQSNSDGEFFNTTLSEPTPFPDNCGYLCVGWTPAVQNDPNCLPLHGDFDNLYILSHPLTAALDLENFAVNEMITKHEKRCFWVNKDGRDAEIKKLSIPICFSLCGDLCSDGVPVCESLTIEKTSGQWPDVTVEQTIIDINAISEWPGCFTLTKLEDVEPCDGPQYHANLCLDFADLFCCPLVLKDGEAVRVRVQYVHSMHVVGMSVCGCYVGEALP